MNRSRYIAVAITLLAAATAGLGVAALGPTDALPVGVTEVADTGSMRPTFQGGEFVVYAETGDYDRGDVVIYESDVVDSDLRAGEHALIMHRVVDQEEQGYVTQGDAYPQTDVFYHDEYATREKIIGEVVFVLRF